LFFTEILHVSICLRVSSSKSLKTELKKKPFEGSLHNEGYNSLIEIKPKVLVVDDNQVNRNVAAEILRKAGCYITVANSGIQAIEKVKSKDFDIIFMDIQMPEMDGVEATRQIKALGKKMTPIIAMTAYSMEGDKQKYLLEGLDDYVSKPLRASKLIQKIKIWLSKSKDQSKQAGFDMHGNGADSNDDGDLKVINFEVIDQLRKYGSDDLINSVFSDFEDETRRQIDTCRISVKNNDYLSILENLHTLKGNAGTLGIEKMAYMASHIETNLRNHDYSNLKKDIKELGLAFDEFKNQLTDIITN